MSLNPQLGWLLPVHEAQWQGVEWLLAAALYHFHRFWFPLLPF